MANLSVEDVVVQGFARVQEYVRSMPAVRSVLYRRINVRQSQLTIAAARNNRDYYGVAAIATLLGGAADVNDILTPVPPPELIHKITVDTVAAGAVPNIGDEVSIVRLGDETAEEPPRVTLRSGVLRQVGVDLLNVLTLKVYYSKLPDALLPAEPGTTLVALPNPHDELLVIDIAKLLVGRSMRGEPNDTAKKIVLDSLTEEEGKMEAAWIQHVRGWSATRSRFERA